MYYIATVAILLILFPEVEPFAPQSTINSLSSKEISRKCREFVQPLLQQNEYNDFSSEKEDSMKNEEEEARLLAQQFYQQVKLREQQKKKASESNIPSPPSSKMTSQASDATETYTVSSPSNSKRTKFTGRPRELDSTGTPSAGLFSRNNASVMAFPASPSSTSPRSPMSSSSPSSPVKERMMQQEFNLLKIASNETILVLQMVGVLALLGFTVYIGLNGGITDGSDRFGDTISEFNGGLEVLDFRQGGSVLMEEGASSSTMSSTSDVWL